MVATVRLFSSSLRLLAVSEGRKEEGEEKRKKKRREKKKKWEKIVNM
jgi:hypothetical protein